MPVQLSSILAIADFLAFVNRTPAKTKAGNIAQYKLHSDFEPLLLKVLTTALELSQAQRDQLITATTRERRTLSIQQLRFSPVPNAIQLKLVLA